MTFTELQDAAAERLNIVGVEGLARIGHSINIYYKRVTSSLGIATSRRTIVQATVTLGVDLLTFDGITKIHHVEDRSTTPPRILDEVSNEEIAEQSQGETATRYAIYSTTASSVTIRLNAIPQTEFTLYAEVLDRADTMAGSDEPAFSEDFHDLLVSAAIYEERLKMEKPQMAMIAKAEYEDRLGDLRMFIAKTAQQDIFQGKRPSSGSTGSGGAGGSSVNGASSYTQTGLITFDRDPSAPFAVSPGSAVVPNLNADLLDGLDSTDFAQLPIVESDLSLSDNTTDNVTSTQHGFAPKSPADATKFLNGAATPAFAAVKDSDLSTSDVTTNNVTSTKHGFAPKSGADATKFLNGAATPAFAAIKDSDLSTSDITTNDVSTSKHGFTPKAPNDTTKFLRGDGAWAIPVANTTVALTDGATPALDASLGSVFRLAAAGDRTIAVPTNPTSGQKIVIQHFASGGARTLALNTGAGGFRYGSDITALSQTASGKTDYIGCIYNATDSKWDVVAYSKGY